MAIYTRDNINYGGMLQAALQNKSNYLKNRYDRVAQMGQNWGNAIANSGKVAQDAMFKIAGNYYDQDKIAQQQEFQASEAEKRALEALERQKQQEEFQKAENKLNRQNTYDIALLNKETVADEKKDEYQLHYQKAKSYYDMISKQAADDEKNTELQRAKADAEWDLKYWAKKAGVNVATQPTQAGNVAKPTPPTGDKPEFGADFLNEVGYAAEPPKPEDNFDNAELTSLVDELLKDWTNANKVQAQDLVSKIQDPALKSKYEKIINAAGKTKEERQVAFKKAKADLQAAKDAALAKGPASYRNFMKLNESKLKTYGLL